MVKDTLLEKRAHQQLTVAGNNPTLDQRIGTMDAEGIDIEAISINEWWYGADRDLARKVCDVQNEGLVKLCKQEPDRLVAFASVALQFPAFRMLGSYSRRSNEFVGQRGNDQLASFTLSFGL